MSRYADIRGLALPNTPPAELASIQAATGLIPGPACVSAVQGKTGKRMSRVPAGPNWSARNGRAGYREGAGVCARGQLPTESFPTITQWPCEGGVVRTGNGGRKTA